MPFSKKLFVLISNSKQSTNNSMGIDYKAKFYLLTNKYIKNIFFYVLSFTHCEHILSKGKLITSFKVWSAFLLLPGGI
jgi:hypothetical protein